ncbi:MAG TPA: hypothetical protein VFC50_03885 [Candidatus Dormibacteraeota bacterium]|nr:hypothetical protein [Candidatus Dormibacteraeota bacterium]
MEKSQETKTRRVSPEKAKAQASRIAERLSKAATEKMSSLEPAPERIGHMLVAANEAAPTRHISNTGKSVLEAVRRADKNPERPPERPAAPVSEKRISTISRAELLSMSEQIMIDGSSLRQIYESHLIGERGLRRLVAEHLEGRDLRKALRQEVVEREIDFERDPDVRDIIPQEVPKSMVASGQGKQALDELLEKAAVNISDSGEEAAFFKARALYEASQLQQHKQSRHLVDIGVAGIIVILMGLILVLSLTRS